MLAALAAEKDVTNDNMITAEGVEDVQKSGSVNKDANKVPGADSTGGKMLAALAAEKDVTNDNMDTAEGNEDVVKSGSVINGDADKIQGADSTGGKMLGAQTAENVELEENVDVVLKEDAIKHDQRIQSDLNREVELGSSSDGKTLGLLPTIENGGAGEEKNDTMDAPVEDDRMEVEATKETILDAGHLIDGDKGVSAAEEPAQQKLHPGFTKVEPGPFPKFSQLVAVSRIASLGLDSSIVFERDKDVPQDVRHVAATILPERVDKVTEDVDEQDHVLMGDHDFDVDSDDDGAALNGRTTRENGRQSKKVEFDKLRSMNYVVPVGCVVDLKDMPAHLVQKRKHIASLNDGLRLKAASLVAVDWKPQVALNAQSEKVKKNRCIELVGDIDETFERGIMRSRGRKKVEIKLARKVGKEAEGNEEKVKVNANGGEERMEEDENGNPELRAAFQDFKPIGKRRKTFLKLFNADANAPKGGKDIKEQQKEATADDDDDDDDDEDDDDDVVWDDNDDDDDDDDDNNNDADEENNDTKEDSKVVDTSGDVEMGDVETKALDEMPELHSAAQDSSHKRAEGIALAPITKGWGRLKEANEFVSSQQEAAKRIAVNAQDIIRTERRLNPEFSTCAWLEKIHIDARLAPSEQCPLIFDRNDPSLKLSSVSQGGEDDGAANDSGENGDGKGVDAETNGHASGKAEDKKDDKKSDVVHQGNVNEDTSIPWQKRLGKIKHAAYAKKLSDSKPEKDQRKVWAQAPMKLRQGEYLKLTFTLHQQKDVRHAAGIGKITRNDLTARSGNVVLMEYIEERPPLKCNKGMQTKVCDFYVKKEDDDDDVVEPGEVPTIVLPPASEENPSPFVGSIEHGKKQRAIYNNMYVAPAYEGRMRVSDYLVCISHRRAIGKQEQIYGYARPIQKLLTIGQQMPRMEVYHPSNVRIMRSRYRNFLERFVRFHVCKKLDQNFAGSVGEAGRSLAQPFKLDMVQEMFPSCPSMTLKTIVERHIAEKKQGRYYRSKKHRERNSLSDLRNIIEPEEVCLFQSMYHGILWLKSLGMRRFFNFKNYKPQNKTVLADVGKRILPALSCAFATLRFL